jgi:hypothetical protein
MSVEKLHLDRFCLAGPPDLDIDRIAIFRVLRIGSFPSRWRHGTCFMNMVGSPQRLMLGPHSTADSIDVCSTSTAAAFILTVGLVAAAIASPQQLPPLSACVDPDAPQPEARPFATGGPVDTLIQVKECRR